MQKGLYFQICQIWCIYLFWFILLLYKNYYVIVVYTVYNLNANIETQTEFSISYADSVVDPKMCIIR